MKRSLWMVTAILIAWITVPVPDSPAAHEPGHTDRDLTAPTTAEPVDEQQVRRFQGKVVALRDEKLEGRDIAMRVRTDQGLMPVEAGPGWEEQKEQLGLNNGDDVEITGFLTGFGAQRRIIAQQISAHGKTVRFETSGEPYRETGRDEGTVETPPRRQEPSTPNNERQEMQRP